METAGFKAADEPLQFAVPFPSENHPQVLEPAKKNLKASQDYVKDLPDREIAETAMEIIRGMTSADLYWHAKLDKTAIQFPDKYENDKYNLYLPSFTATIFDSRVVVCLQVAPWDFDIAAKPYLRTSYRHSVFTVAKILTNLGADVNNPIIQILSNPPADKAWLRSYYLQTPEAADDPYRYYRW